MANIQPKIISYTGNRIVASIDWSNLDDLNTWSVTWKILDATDAVIQEATQPIPGSALLNAGMTQGIANALRQWVAQQASVTVVV